MRTLIFVRLIIVILVNAGACFGVSLNTRRDERLDTIPTRAETTNGVDDKAKSSSNDKNNEARGPEVVDFLSQPAVRLVHRDFEKGEVIQKLSSGIKNSLNPQFVGDVSEIMRHDYWQGMAMEAYDWLQKGINPKTVFSYLNLESVVHQGTDLVTMKYDPKLIFWFHYIKNYRLIDSTGLHYSAFNNRELLGLLAEHIQPQVDYKLMLPLHDESFFEKYKPVVLLFDSYRNEQHMENFAADMLAYMVTDSITADLVLDEWLLKKESPRTIFKALHLGDNDAPIGSDDVEVFSGWLKYIKKYLYAGASDFDIGQFIVEQLPTMSTPRAKVMFESNAIENVLGDVQFHTGNLAAHVRDVWQRFPQVMFSYWKLPGKKIASGDSPSFVKFISSIAVHAASKPFNGDLVFDLLHPKHSLDEVVRLFRELEQSADSTDYLRPYEPPIVKLYAHTMVQYLSDPSFMLKRSMRAKHPESILEDLISKESGVSVFLEWFPAFVSYYQRVEKKSLEKAIIQVILLMQNKLRGNRRSSGLWPTILEQLQNGNAHVKSAVKFIQHMAREQYLSG